MRSISDESQEGESAGEEWPEVLDALVAAPDHHTLLFENDRVRVLDTCIKPGDETPVQTHRWPATFYICSLSPFLRFDDHGNLLLDSRTVAAFDDPPDAIWSDALPPHSLRNIGDADIRITSVELKS